MMSRARRGRRRLDPIGARGVAAINDQIADNNVAGTDDLDSPVPDLTIDRRTPASGRSRNGNAPPGLAVDVRDYQTGYRPGESSNVWPAASLAMRAR